MIWFAMGAGVSAIAAMISQLLLPPTVESQRFLRVEEPEFDPTLEEWEDMSEIDRKHSNIAVRVGEVVRNCGVENFEINQFSSLHQTSPFVRIPLKNTKSGALDCVLTGSQSIDARVSFEDMTEN